MARPRKVKQTEEAVNPAINPESQDSNTEFDTSLVNEAVQEKAPEAEKVVKRDLADKVPTAEQKQAVHRVLEKKVVNVVPAVRDQIQVTFKGSPRTYSSETLKVMLRSFPNDIKINGEPVTLDANGRCCG